MRLASLAAGLAAASALRPPPEELYPRQDASKLPRWRELMAGRFDANEPLRQAAARVGIYVGAAINVAGVTNASEPLYLTTFQQQYNLATAENECKTEHTEPTQGNFTLQDCEFLLNTTTAEGGYFRGHNTVWGMWNPAFETALNGTGSAAQLTAALTGHINGVIGAFKGRVHTWDVVNEPISDGAGTNVPLYKNVDPWLWSAASPSPGGLPRYVETALKAARAADPSALLFVNDYGAEGLNNKSARVYAMASDFKARGVPLDGIGLQMHVSVGNYPAPADVSANIARLGKLGLTVHITEMDVACGPTPACDLDAQAAVYGAMLNACLENANCRSFESWGFTDRDTWVGTDKVPLPFDVNFQPKPAVPEMLAVFAAHAQRRQAAAQAALAAAVQL